VQSVSKWETEEPGCSEVGAYIWTCPLAWRPPLRIVPAATTALPVQWRLVSSLADAARSALVMLGQPRAESWSSRNFM
jgi:hypothetical protein